MTFLASRRRAPDPRAKRARGASGGVLRGALGLAVLAGAVLVLGSLLLLADDAQASHTRGGSITWEVENTTGNGVDIRIKVQTYWRTSYGGCPAPCVVGQVITGGTPTSGQIYSGVSATPVPHWARVIAVDGANDWYGVEVIPSGGSATATPGVVVNYPTPLDAGNPWTAEYRFPCCRVSNPSTGGGVSWHHINNNDGDMHLLTDIVADGINRAPVVALPPIVICDRPAVCTFPIPAVDPDGDLLTWRLATSAEATPSGFTAFDQPGPPDATNALSVNPTTGVATWDTTGSNFATASWPPGATQRVVYSAHVVVEDGRNGTQSAVDWFIRLVPPMPNPPYWDMPPTPCGQTLMVIAGDNLNFTVRARSNDPNRIITIGASAMPSPLASMVWAAWGNPSSGVFDWNTTGGDIGNYIMVFWAVDDRGASAPICSVIIRVVTAIPDFTCTTAAWPDVLKVYVTPTLFDPNGLVVDEWWRVNGGGEIRPTPSSITRPPPGGNFTLTYSVRDSFGNVMSTTKTCYARPNLPPVMDPVPDQTVMSSRLLVYQTNGWDPDGDPVEYQATGLPPGALLNEFGAVRWRAPIVSAPVTYTVSAWVREGLTTPPRDLVAAPLLDSNVVTYTVTVVPMPEPSPDDPDRDADGVVDRYDNCPDHFNDEQADADEDGVGDACLPMETGGGREPRLSAAEADAPRAQDEAAPVQGPVAAPLDADGDGVADALDLCPLVPDPPQADLDGDRVGDACDADLDGDGVAQVDSLGRLLDACPRDAACSARPGADGAGGLGSGPAGSGGAVGSGGASVVDAVGEDAGPDGTPQDAADDDALLARVPGWGWGLAALLAVALVVGVLVPVLARRRRTEA